MHAIGCCLSPLLRKKTASLMYFLRTICSKGCITSASLCGCCCVFVAEIGCDQRALFCTYFFFQSRCRAKRHVTVYRWQHSPKGNTHTHTLTYLFSSMSDLLFPSLCSALTPRLRCIIVFAFFSYLFTTCCPFISRLFSLHCIQRMWDDV